MFTFKHFCLAAVVTALPATAMADISYYLGAGVGGSRLERDDINISFDQYTSGTSVITDPPYNVPYREQAVTVQDPEGTDFTFKVFAGARFGTYLGVEAGYINMGEPSDAYAFEIPAIFSTAANLQVRPLQERQIDVETKLDGFQGYLVGFWPLTDTIEVFGKVGLLAWNQDTLIVDRIGVLTPVDQPGVPEIILCPAGPTEPDGTCAVAPDGTSFYSLASSDDGTDLALGAGINLKASERVTMRAELEWYDIDNASLAWSGSVSLVFGF